MTRCCEQLREDQYASVEQLRALTAAALEDRLTRWWAASESDPKAMRIVLQILKARARLFGLYAPDRFPLDQEAVPPKVQIEFVRTGYFEAHPDEAPAPLTGEEQKNKTSF